MGLTILIIVLAFLFLLIECIAIMEMIGEGDSTFWDEEVYDACRDSCDDNS